MAALRRSSASALPKPFAPGSPFHSHRRLNSLDPRKAGLGRKRGLEAASDDVGNFDTESPCSTSTLLLKDGNAGLEPGKAKKSSVRKVPEAEEPPEKSFRPTPDPLPEGSELQLGRDRAKGLPTRRAHALAAGNPFRTTPTLLSKDDGLYLGSGSVGEPFIREIDDKPLRPNPVPLYKVIRPSVLRGKKLGGGESSGAVPVELVRVLDLYEELCGNRVKGASTNLTHNVIPSAGAASRTKGCHIRSRFRTSRGINTDRMLLRFVGVGLPMRRVSGRAFHSALMFMHAGPGYQSCPNPDGASTGGMHLMHASVESSLGPFGKPNNIQRELKDQGRLAIRDRLRLWEQKQGNVQYHRLPDEEEDLGQEGEVVNMQTRPRVSNPLIDTMNNSLGDGLTSPSLSGEDLSFEFGPAQVVLNCGDLVELSMSGPGYDSVLGILTRQLGDQLQFYTMQGRWVHRPRKEVYFRVPNFVSQKLVEPVLRYLPSQQLPEHLEDRLQFFDASVPREVGAPLIERMRAFYNSSELIYRETFTVLDKAHDLLSDKTDTLIMTLADIAHSLLTLAEHNCGKLDELSPAELYAVHRTLTRSETGFAIQLGGVDVARYFTIYPKAQVEMLASVRQWVRAYQESLNTQHYDRTSTWGSKDDTAGVAIVHGFVEKARRLVKASRERREPPRFGCIGPSVPNSLDRSGILEPITVEKFSSFEGVIIRFIEIWCSGEFGNYSTLNSLPPIILRATGMYGEVDLGSATGFAFLQEIGVYTPWDRVSVYHKGLALPGHGVSVNADDYLNRVSNMSKSSPLELADTMGALRRDWGDLNVYCIDDVQAKEIDDGISLERIPGSTSEYWIHVHVANPSAFIGPDHWIAKMAQKTAETIYTPERTYPMLPSSVVDGKLSLGVNSPVLTFSAKLDEGGEITTRKITPSIIRKVTHLTASRVDKVLGVQRVEPTVIRVGREMGTRRRPELGKLDDIPESQKADFKIFKMLAIARRQKRLRNGAVSVVMPGINCSVFGSVFDGPARPPSRGQGQFWKGDPAIEMTSNWFDPTGKGYPAMDGDRIVEEFMVLASEVAAGWCHERNIPVAFVSSVSTPSCRDPTEFHRKVLLSSVSAGGYYPYDLGLEYLRLTAVTVSTTGGPLVRSGVDRYVRCTSPLRRYSDMLLHWQVEAALRYEAQHGQSSLIGNLREGYLPFSRAQVDELLPWLQWRRRLMTMTSRNAQRFWAAQLLMRAVFYGEAELPRTFEMRVVKTVGYRQGVEVFGILMTLNVQVFAIVPGWMDRRGVKVGERYEVEIKDIDVFNTVVRVSPLRFIGDD